MKVFKPLFLVLLIASPVMGGGIMTNTNQSAAWARTLTREACLAPDAVYYNPAGLAQMDNGLHISLSNQTIFQTRIINSEYPLIAGAPKDYQADLVAPVFPSVYAAYKMDKWAFSAGFNIIGGGGSADFSEGLPSFEMPVAGLIPVLQGSLSPLDAAIEAATGTNPGFANVTGYNMNASFKGSSNYMGFQLGAAYAITDMISVAIGGRLVTASNTYEGDLSGVTIDAPAAYGGTQTPGNYLRVVASTPGLDPGTVGLLNGTAAALDAATADAALKAVQKGMGFTPIIGVNLHLTDMVNVAARYEHHTKIELTNETEVDNVGMFPDGAKTRADLPGMFALGVQVSPLDKLTISAGFNYFLDKGAYYGQTDENGEQINNETTIENNTYNVSASLEYKFLGILGVSAGYMYGNLGVNDDYQSDLSYTNSSSTIGGGLFVDIGKMITINAGVAYVMYDDYTKDYVSPLPYSETFKKQTTLVAIGVDINL
jgi:long-subunit fatty acid transport protein